MRSLRGHGRSRSAAFAVAPDRSTYRVYPAAVRTLSCQDCAPDVADWAPGRREPEPVLPHSVPLHLTTRSQTVPRHAIVTQNDRTIPPGWQAHVVAGLPPGCISTLPCGYAPFFALPELVARRLIDIGRRFGAT